jgi:hypothetical protein
MVLSGINELSNLQKNELVRGEYFPMTFVERLFVIKIVKDIPFVFDTERDFKKSIHPLKSNDSNNEAPFQDAFISILRYTMYSIS